MTNQPRNRLDSDITCGLTTARWIGGSCLDLVSDFNDRYLENLARAAECGRIGAMPAIVRAHQALWLAVNDKVRQRASTCPFLLADFQFNNVSWWQRAQSGERLDLPDPTVWDFPWIIAVDLARDALTVAWYAARQDICLATLLIGVPAQVAEIISKFTLQALWRLADHYHPYLRPRYESRSGFWNRLLSAAAQDDRDALHDLHRSAFLFADSEHARRAPARSRGTNGQGP